MGDGEPLRLADFTVRAGTLLQMADVAGQRRVCHTAFVCEALAAPPAAELAWLYRTFDRLWRGLRWEPRHKEVFWRLAVDGVPVPGSSHLPAVPREPCPCGAFPVPAGAAVESPRLHHWWSCLVAQALVAELSGRCGVPVCRRHLWLAVCPAPHVAQCVWDAVVVAAQNACEWGRRQGRPHRLPRPAAAALAAGVVAQFWAHLRDFAELGLPVRGWGDVGPDHPFLRVVGGRLEVASA
jgi:hypothetical protein